MDVALLRTFVMVHRAGSFTRAAALLGLSQPAVTSQIRTLERQLGRPLFLRRARGVTPTSVGDELAHRAAPHLDALAEIAEGALTVEAPLRTLHLAGPPEFMADRVLPALAGLRDPSGPSVRLRAAFGSAEEVLEGLAAGHHDLAVTTRRPRGTLLSSGTLCDEEHLLVAAPHWAARFPPGAVRRGGAQALDKVPVVDVHETLPFTRRYWATVFEAPPPEHAAVVAPDLRAVLACVVAGAGMAVLPRYLCEETLLRRELVTLLEPPLPPLRTYFLAVRTGTQSLPHLAAAHEWLMRAAVAWG
ncbi:MULTISPECIES: LysR family transcriptional regulator [Streptomyces diastaticus group]|uniref:LysR family transcriptional regulator n=1 Tax=Streptomyces gougerotii TaxID=53448 RepID=A0A8H9HQY7_9ACTN|nr:MULTISPECIES: LysR family transcriptional regulator [Streptomyces diastaticus group]WSU36772.1 LysR family transcriptional regulator [Streptomyces gougerotii]GFH64621.1 LysR family transcriptional regulator [Streptomyces rutgersensis]GFH77772.1 LysR family transcriptional regulator [Streptomyces gougerotii]GGU82397.1 LysR family transcriptional regulator [Streptomyces gougerotii]